MDFFTAEGICKEYELPPESRQCWRWSDRWEGTLTLGSQIGADFERGLVRAVGASNEALDARAAIGGSRPTSLNALSILMRALVSIDLRDNRITDLEASGLASGLRLAVSLSKLYLSGNRISSSGAKELGKALVTSGKSAKSVAELDLSRNPLGSSGGRPKRRRRPQRSMVHRKLMSAIH